jgi:hypothetical protein
VRYRAESLKLIGAINCGLIGDAIYDVIEPLLTFPLLRETVYTVREEENFIKVDWDGMLAAREHRIKELEDEVTRLKSVSKDIPKPTEAPKKIAEQMKKIAKEPKPSPSATEESEATKKPDGFINDIHVACQKGHTKSVAFLLAKDMSLLEKTDWNDLF